MRIVVLISGRGSNLAAILARQETVGLGGGEVVCVVSNNPDAPGLEHARGRGIPVEVIRHQDYANRLAFDEELTARIEAQQADLVVLAGFMRILTAWFADRFEGRLINTHPSLLPKYPGVDAVGQALQAGETETGCTVHFVTEIVDGGPIIGQRKVPIEPGDSHDALERRVLATEHQLLPDTITAFCRGELAPSEP